MSARSSSRPGRLAMLWWLRLPRAAASLDPSLGAAAADGHWLAAVPVVGDLAPPAALLVGMALGAWHVGFDVAATESLLLLAGMAAVGFVSAQLGAWLLAGFAVGDLFVFHGSWRMADVPAAAVAEHGWLADPVVAHLLFERAPLVVHWLLLALLVVGVPSLARRLAGSLGRYLRGSPTVDLVVAGLLAAVACYVVARLWAAAAPLVIRPLFATAAPWQPDPIVPEAAISPLQQRGQVLSRLAVALMAVRFALVWAVSQRPAWQARLNTLEGMLLAPLDSRPPGRVRLAAGCAAAGGLALLLLAGVIEAAWAAVVVFTAAAVIRAASSGLLPVPTAGWRQAMERMPVALRFAVGLLIVNGLAGAVIGSAHVAGESFQFLVWPILAGAAVLAVLLPAPARQPAPSEGVGQASAGRLTEAAP